MLMCYTAKLSYTILMIIYRLHVYMRNIIYLTIKQHPYGLSFTCFMRVYKLSSYRSKSKCYYKFIVILYNVRIFNIPTFILTICYIPRLQIHTFNAFQNQPNHSYTNSPLFYWPFYFYLPLSSIHFQLHDIQKPSL